MGWPSLSDVANGVRNTVSNAANNVRETVDGAVQGARDLGSTAVNRATELGRAGVDLGRQGVEAVRNFDVREAAATVRQGIGSATETARQGISDGVMWAGDRVEQGADFARSHVTGDDILSRGVRGVIDTAETTTRFQLGVVGGVSREVVGTVGAVGQLGTTLAEMQVSPEARLEYGQQIAIWTGNTAGAIGAYTQSVVADPSRLGRDAQAAADGIGGFVNGQFDRYGQAIANGQGPETIGMDVGTVATYVVPVGGGPARGALTGAARTAVREGTEATVRTVGREGAESLARAATPAAAAAERNGASLLTRAEAAGGTIPLEQGAGRIADIAAASRQSGREIAVYRDLASGERRLVVGGEGAVQVPGNSRLIAHTQPGTGPAALAPSAADQAGLARLGQSSSAIIDDSGAIARFGIDDAARTATPRATAGEVVTLNAPRSVAEATTELQSVVRSELSTLRTAGASNNRLGPAASAVMDTRTGEVSRVFTNNRSGDLPAQLNPVLADRLDAARSIDYQKTAGAGSHSEVYAVNEMLNSGSRLEDLVVYTEQIGGRYAGGVKPPCPHCSALLEGVTYAQ